MDLGDILKDIAQSASSFEVQKDALQNSPT